MLNSQIPIPEDNRILFFKRDREIFGFLSNYHEAPVAIDGEIWQSTEYYYQAQKSLDVEYRDAIRQATSANHAKGLGTDPNRSRKARQRSWFRSREDRIRPDWPQWKLRFMIRAVHAKFTQNPDLQQKLLATGDAQIVEDSTHDPFWGIGRDGGGSNWMGRVLMQIRFEILNSAPNPGEPLDVDRILELLQSNSANGIT